MPTRTPWIPLSLSALVCLTVIVSPIECTKLYMSRAEMIALLSKEEGRLYFDDCEQKSNPDNCFLAIDSGVILEPSQCAMSEIEEQPWWSATLETPSFVTKVTVVNMDNSFRSYRDALTDMTLLVGDEACFRYQALNDVFIKRTFPCDAIGDTVTIQSNFESAMMTICDVEVFGVPVSFPSVMGPNELLTVVECTQSSVHGDGACQNAFDGDVNPDHRATPCAVTEGEPQPWIQARLGTASLVRRVDLFSRQDCCMDSLKNIRLLVNGRVCFEQAASTGFRSASFICRQFGDLVRLQSNEIGSMSVCEMKILGYPANLNEPDRFNFLGCFADKLEDPDLPQLVSSTRMSSWKCYRICKRLNQTFFGLQNGFHCFCGEAHGKYGKVADSACNVNCDNDPTEKCGGSDKNSVFQIV